MENAHEKVMMMMVMMTMISCLLQTKVIMHPPLFCTKANVSVHGTTKTKRLHLIFILILFFFLSMRQLKQKTFTSSPLSMGHYLNDHPSPSAATMQFITSSAQKYLQGMASSLIHHIIHPFISSSYRWHIVGLIHDFSPVTTHSCLSSLLNHVVITTTVAAT